MHLWPLSDDLYKQAQSEKTHTITLAWTIGTRWVGFMNSCCWHQFMILPSVCLNRNSSDQATYIQCSVSAEPVHIAAFCTWPMEEDVRPKKVVEEIINPAHLTPAIITEITLCLLSCLM